MMALFSVVALLFAALCGEAGAYRYGMPVRWAVAAGASRTLSVPSSQNPWGRLCSASRLRATTLTTEPDAAAQTDDKVIIITPKAMSHIRELRAKMQDGKDCLRMGVKSGGCSGMSYVMDFISADGINEDDHVEMSGDIKCAIDPKSLLYLFGLQLDYSDELIGGGFKFSNPNAETSCGCGKSFGV